MKTTLSALAAGLFLVGCSGSTTNALTTPDSDAGASDASAESSTSSGYTLDNVCAKTAPKICSLRQNCCTTAGFGFDEVACEAYAQTECAKDVAEAKAGTMTFDPSNIDSCIEKLRPYYDRCNLTFSDLQTVATALNGCQVFRGQRTPGATCDRSSQCAAPASPNTFVDCNKTKKVCSETKFLDSGAACSISQGVAAFCKDGTYCALADGSLAGACQTATAHGAQCNKTAAINLECGLGWYCDSTTSLCTEAKVGGASCESDLECRSFSCGTNKKCVAPDPLVKAPECGK